MNMNSSVPYNVQFKKKKKILLLSSKLQVYDSLLYVEKQNIQNAML